MYQFMAVIIATAFISSAVTLTISADGPTGFGTVLEPGSMVESYAFMIFEDDGLVYAKSGRTGSIMYDGPDLYALWTAIGLAGETGKMYISPGTYTYSQSLVIKPHQSLIGSGTYDTILDVDAAVWAITMNSSATYNILCEVSSITIQGNSLASGILVTSVTPFSACMNRINNVQLVDVASGIRVVSTVSESYQTVVSNFRIVGQTDPAGYGIYNKGAYNTFQYGEIVLTEGYAIFDDSGQHATFTGIAMDGPMNLDSYFGKYENLVIESLHSDSPADYCVRVSGRAPTLSNINLIEIPSAKAAYGFVFYGIDCVIEKCDVYGAVYPTYSYNFGGGSSGVGVGLWGLSASWTHITHEAVRNWTFIGGLFQDSGVISVTGAVSTVVVTYPHALAIAPTIVLVTTNNTGCGNYSVSFIGSTYSVITFTNQPASSTWKFYWYAEV
jgi:hypothetical protein